MADNKKLVSQFLIVLRLSLSCTEITFFTKWIQIDRFIHSFFILIQRVTILAGNQISMFSTFPFFSVSKRSINRRISAVVEKK